MFFVINYQAKLYFLLKYNKICIKVISQHQHANPMDYILNLLKNIFHINYNSNI